MPDASDSYDVPAWIPSTCEVIEVKAPRTVRLKALGSRVIFDEVPANSRVTMEWAPRTNIEIQGRNVEGGSRISLVGRGHRKVAATVLGFPEVELDGEWHPQSRIQSDAASWYLQPSNIQLERPGGISTESLKFHVKGGDGDVGIRLTRGHARVVEVESHTTGVTNVNMEVAPGAEFSAVGTLTLADHQLQRVAVQASAVTIGGPVEGGTFDVDSTATFKRAVSSFEGEQVVISGGQIRFEDAVEDAAVTGQAVHASSKLENSTIKAEETVEVGEQIVDCDVRMVSDGRLQVGNQIPTEVPSSNADAKSLEGVRHLVTEQSEPTGSLSRSSIFSDGTTHIAAGAIEDCSIETKGDVVATIRLSQAARQDVYARNLAAARLTISDAVAVSVQQLTSIGDFSLFGRLKAPVVIVGGSLTRDMQSSSAAHATLDTKSCYLAGGVDNVRIEADHADVAGELNASSKLVVREKAKVNASGAAIEFVGAGSKWCELSGRLKDLVVPAETEAFLTFVTSDVVITNGEVRGQLTLQSQSWESVALAVEDRLTANILTPEVDSSVFMLESGSSLVCKDGSRSLTIECFRMRDSDLTMAIESTGKARARVNLRSAREDVDSAPNVTVTGGVDLSLAGLLHTVEFQRAGLIPQLSLSDKSANVTRAFGSVWFGSVIAGRLHGVRPSRGSYEALRIVGIEPQEEGSSSGVVLDADLTQVPFEQLTRLNDIGIVDPTPESMVAFATSPPRAAEATAKRAELRSRSEHATRLVNVVGSKAIPGSSLAACNWAAARLHHRSLSQGIEKTVRYAHWAVGYSQRPLYALVCLLSTIGMAAGLRLWKWGHDGMALGLPELGEALMSTILLPLSVVRFASNVDPLYFNRFFNLVAFAALALTFIFFVISVRNYMRTPGEK